jgi:hypothetical protein
MRISLGSYSLREWILQMVKIRSVAAVALTLLSLRAPPVAGQFWQATPKEVKYHATLAPFERELIYGAVLADADSLVRAVWGTPDSWDQLKGRPPEGRPLTLTLDPRIYGGSLLTGPPIAGRHEATWVGALQQRGLIAGECATHNDHDPCDQGDATMVLLLSSIAPGQHHTVTVLLTMMTRGAEGERGFFSEWLVRLKQVGGAWRVTERRMGAIS